MSSRSKQPRVAASKRKRHVEEGEWDCVHCTFKNEPINGKCAVCDIPRGTSTRRGGYNPQLVAQQELEEMLASDRAKQKRVKARTGRDASVTSLQSDASTPPGPRSPSPHLTDTSSMASPKTRKKKKKSSFFLSETSSFEFSEVDPAPGPSPGPASSSTQGGWTRSESRSHLSADSVEKGKKRPRGRPKKTFSDATVAPPSPSHPLVAPLSQASFSLPFCQRRSRFFTIAHDGLTLEFEEIIPSDAEGSDFEEEEEEEEEDGDESDDRSKSNES